MKIIDYVKKVFNKYKHHTIANQIIDLNSKKISIEVIYLLIGMIFYKSVLEIGYKNIISNYKDYYDFEFCFYKYIIGFIWCIVLFFGINHKEKKASSFLLYFTLLIQIVPLTIVYSLADESSIYFNSICVAFLICEIIIFYFSPKLHPRDKKTIYSCILEIIFFIIIITVFVAIIFENGFPSLKALDISNVYEIRRSGDFIINKYLNYLLNIMVKVIIPIFIVRFIISQKYWFSALFCCMQFVLYLYTGHKTWLFVIPLAVAVGFWTKRKHFYKEFLLCICFGVGILTILACMQPDNSFFQRMFSFLGRRAIIDPAYNKFAYFDYFSNHPLVGLGGMIPRWLIHIPNYYENISYPMEIGRIYFNEPDMYCNTGFLAEGFMRFGHVGTILILVLFAMILLQIDAFQKRVGFRMAVGFFIYPIYSLVDAHLIDSFIFGPWMVLEIILLFYTHTDWKDYELLLQKSKRIIKRTMGIFKKQ